MIVLGLYLMYDYNIFYFRDLFNLQKLDAIIDEAADDVYNDLDKYFGNEDSNDSSNTNYNDWVNNNCNCEDNNNGVEDENEYEESSILNEEVSPLASGIYYYDGTAPKQLINPLPNKNNTDKIYYPDYDQPGHYLNNHDHNKLLKERRVLVGSNTYTSNL